MANNTASNNGMGETYYDKVFRDKPFGWHYTAPSTHSYFRFEEINHSFWPDFMSSHREYAYYASIIYLSAVFGIKRWMKDRPAYKLKTPLFLWNLGLGLFSIFGFWRTVPSLVYVAFQTENGFYRSICKKEGMDVQTAYWILLFTFSKFVELGDTVFIVLRKRPLVVLQWYHHLITMSVVWILAPLVEPIARWYAVLNFGVHALMYPYFAFRAIGIRIPTIIANTITTLQLLQMVVGFGVNMISLVYMKLGYECSRYPVSIQLFSLVYGSFLLLFGKLFYDSVIKSGRRKGEQDGKVQQQKKMD